MIDNANPAQLLKIAGHLPGVTLSKLGDASVTRAMMAPIEGDMRCGHPDFPDRELAMAEPAEIQKCLGCEEDIAEAIHEMHLRYYEEATGTGSWPPGKQCHPTLYPHDGYHATTVYVESDGFLSNRSLHREVTDSEWQRVVVDGRVWPSLDNPVASVADCKKLFSYDSQDPRVRVFDRPQWRERSDRKAGQPFTVLDMAQWLAWESIRRTGILFVEVFTGPNGAHNIHEKMIAIPGSTAGYAYFPDGSCGDHVTSNIDSLNTSYSLGWATGLRFHEWGHNLRLEHEFRAPQSGHRSFMSYATDNEPFQGARLAGAPYQYVEDHSWPVLRRYYGGEAAKPIETVTPVPPPSEAPPLDEIFEGEIKDGKIVIRGETTIDYSLSDAKHTYIITPTEGNKFKFTPKRVV